MQQSPKKIALTFDDGPHPVYTKILLDGLAERGAKASFFVTGENAEKYPELILRMQKEGHLIGNHTYSHIQLTSNNREAFRQELISTNEVLKEITGAETIFCPSALWKLGQRLRTGAEYVPGAVDDRSPGLVQSKQHQC